MLYSVDGIREKIINLDFISWFDSLAILGIVCFTLVFLYVAYTNGWRKKFYEYFQGKKYLDLDLINNHMSRSKSLISLATLHSQPMNGQLARN